MSQELLTARFWQASENHVLMPENSEGSAHEIGQALRDFDVSGALSFYSSGTTGSARCVIHSRGGLLASARAVNAHLEARAEDVWLCALPIFHVGGFGVYARAYCSESGVYEFIGGWGAERYREQCIRCSASLSSLVPTQIYDLVEAGVASPPSLRAVLVGGGHLERALELQARALGWPILRTYGLSEAGSQVATQRGESLAVLPHLEAAIGDGGRLRLRGASMLSGYLRQGADGAWLYGDPKDAQAWFQTDDLVELDGQELRFIARKSSRVKVLGELVDVEMLEQAMLRALPKGVEVALVDVPDARSGNALVVVFTDRHGRAWLEEQIDEFNASLTGFERLACLAYLPALPRGPLGKLQRGELRRQVLKAKK